jgi:hypothetical protein
MWEAIAISYVFIGMFFLWHIWFTPYQGGEYRSWFDMTVVVLWPIPFFMHLWSRYTRSRKG